MLFIPKKSKFKKRQKGKKLNTINKVFTLNKLPFGTLGLKAMASSHMNSKQIAALRQTINKLIKKRGKLKINIFPNTQISKKPLEVRMGKGKGNIDRWIFKVRCGTVLCEIQTPLLYIGIQALKLAQYKLPLKTKIIYNL